MNCSRPRFGEKGASLGGQQQNGDSYSGKLYHYVLEDGVCADGSEISATINATGAAFFKMRSECVNLEPPVPIPATEIAMSEDQTSLTYRSQSFYVSDQNGTSNLSRMTCTTTHYSTPVGVAPARRIPSPQESMNLTPRSIRPGRRRVRNASTRLMTGHGGGLWDART